MNARMYNTLEARYQAEIEDAKYKIDAIEEHNMVIPEHVDITGEVDKLLAKISSAEDKLAAMRRHYGEKEAKTLSENRTEENKDIKNPLSFATQESAFSNKSSQDLNLIIKSDVHGSSEAIKNAINQIKHDEVKPKIILADIGMVTETDVTLAKASNAVIIAFNVKKFHCKFYFAIKFSLKFCLL